VFDDFVNIVQNKSLHITDGSVESLIAAATSGTSSPWGRPLSMVSFALNFYFLGDAPYEFKLVNVGIHLVNVVLIFALSRQMWQRLGYDSGSARSLVPSIGVAAAWALHPINLTPVLLVVQRMTSLSALFVLSSLVLYLFGRQAKGKQGILAIGVGLALCWPAAMLSKESGLLLPVYILLCEWLVLGTFQFLPAKRKWLAVSLLGGLVLALCWVKWGYLTAGYSVRQFDVVERLMTEARVLWFYVRQLLLPGPDVFALFHDDIAISRGLLSPIQTLLSIVAWLTVLTLAFCMRKRQPLFTFAVLWFLASHMLESTFLPLEIAFEHRNYIASFGLLFWLASLLLSDRQVVGWPVPRFVLATAFVLLCGVLTGLRSAQWGDEFRRAQIEAAQHPASARANFQAAAATMQRTYEAGGGSPMAYQMIQFHYRRAAELDKTSKATVLGLVYLDCITGVRKNPVDRTSLLSRFSDTPFTYGDRSVVQSLSGLLVEGRLCMDDQEVQQFIKAALANPSADPTMRGMINAVGMDYAAAKMRSFPLALSYAHAAVASDPGSVAFRVNLIHLLMQAHRVDDAKREYITLSEVPRSPQDGPALKALKTMFDATGTSATTN